MRAQIFGFGSLLTTQPPQQAVSLSCSYIEIQEDDDDDDDELPPIPDDWATPIIATHCHPPLQPQSAAAVCAPPSPGSARFHPSSLRSTEDDTRDYKWLTDIFAVCIHFIIPSICHTIYSRNPTTIVPIS